MLIEDCVACLKADAGAMLTKDSGAKAVECQNGHLLGRLGRQQFGKPLAHLARCLVGERHRQNSIGLDQTLFDQTCDADGEDARLARAGSGKHEQRSLVVQHGLLLAGVQSAQQ